MKLQTKTNLFYLVNSIIVILLITLVSLLSFRQFSISTAKDHAITIAESIHVSLTESMIYGTIDKRASYLKRLTQIHGLVSTRITRSDHVSKQFKVSIKSEQVNDNIDQQVLNTGIPAFIIENESTNPILRSTIPFVANSNGTPNCLSCHTVQDGDVLGAVTIKTSIAHLRTSAIKTVGILAGVLIFFSMITIFFTRRLFNPLITTAEEVQNAVAKANKGDFNSKVDVQTDDEIGQIASDFNKLMIYLRDGLKSINDNVSQLIDFKAKKGADSLATTISMVNGLANAARFKQAIEEDETKDEVYRRLGHILQDDFLISRYSIYEISNTKKNKIIPIMVDGVTDSSCKWCDPQILIRSDACRAKRTGHIINSYETPNICNYFNVNSEADQYICLPIIQSGQVGSIVQIVSKTAEGIKYPKLIPFIQPYLREASPVIETKRLMASLKESNLRDAMTGLNNRRFLEEYVETMVANTERTKTSLSILMLDLDYFKKVNDSFGHDVGDKVLIELSKTLVKSVRVSDMVIRYGGEEFLIILQNTSGNYADKVAEKIRLAVEVMKIQVTDTVIQKTISIGIADFPGDSDTFWQALKFADVALYKAKEDGRNRSVHFQPEMWHDHDEF